jgi:futalosine hydrolase
MQLLLCSATELEIKPTIEYLKQTNNQIVDILITGVGLTAATYALTKKLLTKKPDFILQAGVAGCLDDSLPLTKIVEIIWKEFTEALANPIKKSIFKY